jgi:photosystem II stability/assembly factor-like uncharacterized protein
MRFSDTLATLRPSLRRATSFLLAFVLVLPMVSAASPSQPALAALPTATLNAVTFVPASTTAIAVGASGTILRSTNDGATWVSVGPGGSYDFRGVSFRDSSNGLAVSSAGVVFYTSNGGATWTLSSLNLDGSPYEGLVHDVAFVQSDTQSTAFASGRLGLSAPTNTDSAVIWQRLTADGGGEWVPPTWDRFYINTSADDAVEGAGDFYALDFPSATRGYAVGHDRYKENSQPAPYNKALIYIRSGSPSPSWSSAADAKRLADGTGPLYAVSFATESAGIAVGTTGKVFYTADSWNIVGQSSAGSTDLLGAAMTSSTNGWVVGKGGVAGWTTNGGSSWSMQTIASGIELRDVATPGADCQRLSRSARQGRIMRTTNGTTWLQAGEATVPTGTITINSGAAYTNTVNITVTHTVDWKGGGVGDMRHSTNGGASWTAWEPYSASKALTLPGGDGQKSVRVQFKDAAGVESVGTISDSIILDTTPPTHLGRRRGGPISSPRRIPRKTRGMPPVTGSRTGRHGARAADAHSGVAGYSTLWSSATDVASLRHSPTTRSTHRPAPRPRTSRCGGLRRFWRPTASTTSRSRPGRCTRQPSRSRCPPATGVPVAQRRVSASTPARWSTSPAPRFDTAVAASLEAYPDGSQYVIIATGRNWPDALGGAALAGVLDAPILLSEPTSLPSVTADEISRLGATHAIILGGTGAVSSGVRPPLPPLWGFPSSASTG